MWKEGKEIRGATLTVEQIEDVANHSKAEHEKRKTKEGERGDDRAFEATKVDASADPQANSGVSAPIPPPPQSTKKSEKSEKSDEQEQDESDNDEESVFVERGGE